MLHHAMRAEAGNLSQTLGTGNMTAANNAGNIGYLSAGLAAQIGASAGGSISGASLTPAGTLEGLYDDGAFTQVWFSGGFTTPATLTITGTPSGGPLTLTFQAVSGSYTRYRAADIAFVAGNSYTWTIAS